MSDSFLHRRLRRRPWYEFPRLVSMLRLIDMRDDLREQNLHDTEEPPFAENFGPVDPAVREARTVDGSWNDLRFPKMGAQGCRFGRNFPLDQTHPDHARLLEPNPRLVSQTLMTRHAFQPVEFLNLLAASWIQFMVHDWFVHRKGSLDDAREIPLTAGDPWHENPMKVAPSVPDPAPAGSTRPPAYINENSHWWDGSQIYGNTPELAARIRTGEGGRIHVGADGKLPIDPVTGGELTGFIENFWTGLSMLHGLFALEHNAICAMLASHHPDWGDEQLYQKARLINAALMAHIHTVEWTTAILPHRVVVAAMNTNWNGITRGRGDELDLINDSEILGGIMGSPTDHHSAPYSLTEEFVAVYRMHPLMPDEFTLRKVSNFDDAITAELPALSGVMGRQIVEQHSMADLFYSFGHMHPGQIRLHNYPRHLQNLTLDNGTKLDLATIDILRDRERGVPRYNQFRRLLRKDPVRSFEELTDNVTWREEIRAVYNNDLEAVDLMVGLFCEPLPEGFGFSETAFRIFVLMASRRLKSDRFFTSDYTPAMYTPEGIDWVESNGLASVLTRHFPELQTALANVPNPFTPWNKVV
jgi:hypothetical protein